MGTTSTALVLRHDGLLKFRSAILNRPPLGAIRVGLVRAPAGVRRFVRIHVAQRRMWL